MSIFSWLTRKNPLIVRYTNGDWSFSNQVAKYKNEEYMQLYKSVYAINACINIRATYLSKFKWGVEESQGINYDHELLKVIKNPNIYQKSTVDFLKQFEILRSVNGWVYQKTFGAKGFYPEAIYNLPPSKIDFKSNKNNPFLIWKSKDVKDTKDKEFIYDDNGTKKTYRFSEIMPFYDIANGVTGSEFDMFMSPSKIDAIMKNILNLDLLLDAENIATQTIGRESINSTGEGQTKEDLYINGVKSLKEKEHNDIINKLNNKAMLKSQRLRTFTPDMPIAHQDLSLKHKDFELDKLMDKHESVIARAFGVPNEIYQAFKQGATFENQREAEVKFIDNMQEGVVKDLEMTWTNGFGDENKPFKATATHLRSLQEEENKKADKAFKITQSLVNLQRAGMQESQAIDFLEGLGINLND